MNRQFQYEANPEFESAPVDAMILQSRIAAFLNQTPLFRGVQTQAGFSVGSVKGPVRKENQDRVLVCEVAATAAYSHRKFIAVVCDGMGGLQDGGAAATVAASTFVGVLATTVAIGPGAQLTEAILAANRAVFEKLRGRGGTTLTAFVVVDGDRPWCAHVGDSRLYFREKPHGAIRQVTRDDTLEAVLSPNNTEAHDDPGRGLLQFIGMGDDLQPHVFAVQSVREQLAVLTTDGAHNFGGRIFDAICGEARTTDDLTKRVLLLAEAVGARDNASVISVIPSRLVFAEPFPVGISVSLWSPWDRLNVWLPGTFGKAEPPTAGAAMMEPAPAGKTVKAPKRKGKAKPRAKARTPGSESGKSAETKPQVQIVFGQDSDPDDKTS